MKNLLPGSSGKSPANLVEEMLFFWLHVRRARDISEDTRSLTLTIVVQLCDMLDTLVNLEKSIDECVTKPPYLGHFVSAYTYSCHYEILPLNQLNPGKCSGELRSAKAQLTSYVNALEHKNTKSKRPKV